MIISLLKPRNYVLCYLRDRAFVSCFLLMVSLTLENVDNCMVIISSKRLILDVYVIIRCSNRTDQLVIINLMAKFYYRRCFI